MPTVFTSIRRARPLLGTFVEIAAAGPAHIEDAIEAAFGAVASVHALMSFHDVNSDVSRLNREAGRNAVCVHPWTFQVLAVACELHRQSGGCFDIGVAPVLQTLGHLPGSPVNTDLPPERTDSIELLESGRVRFSRPNLMIDLGGIAKGFAVDRAVDTLRNANCTSGLVNAGGDLAAFGVPQNVAIRDPQHPSWILLETGLLDEALASSGRRFDPVQSSGVLDCAVIDPSRQKPVNDIAGVTVRAPSCTLADALTKIVMTVGENATSVLDRYDAAALYMLSNREVRISPNWQKANTLAA